MHTCETFTQHPAAGQVTVEVRRHAIALPAALHVPYEGRDPLVAADFPGGFPPSFGSGIAFREKLPDGTLVFYCLTDRGPNGDGPQVPAPGGDALVESKIFPCPSFHPSIGVLHVGADRAAVVDSFPIRVAEGTLATGLPLPPGADGRVAEMPLHDSLRFDPVDAGFHPNGIDPESLAFDSHHGHLWIADEYGPFLWKIDPATGAVLERFGPGAGLPAILARRRGNRGMEGMTYDPESRTLHAFLQSPLTDGKQVERHARFLRWIEFDPTLGATRRMLAYPLDPAQFADGRTGHAKLGDMAALGAGKFVVIEQGEGSDGKMFNWLMLVDVADASDIAASACNPDTADLEHSSIAGSPVNGASWTSVMPIKKTRLLDLNAVGWRFEKAEGLALVDPCTLAITNDSDFGMKTRVFDGSGEEFDADVTQFEVDREGRIVKGAPPQTVVRVARADKHDGVLTVWLLSFHQALASYGIS